MRFRRWMGLGLCLALAGPVTMMGQAASSAPAAAPTTLAPGDSLGALLSLTEKEVTSAADAMPAEKYDFVPPTTMGLYSGVRSFGAQVKHLAQANYEFFQGWNVPGGVDPKTIDALKTKDDIMKALKDSYAYAHAAMNSITPDNAFLSVPGPPPQWKATRVSMAAFCIAHSMDHYGQIVEYLRMNGIVPPASRKQDSM